ncbi:hypothetical protein AK812_SmicGene38574 [Symbiodinium microadriaticum]|uniref:Uncharacterized protein n=1 Tax=Symbiodinium microadriaticum TaxID=2951 RepID=A0A1Q9CDF9_SYMMI|nr:hypothetical protein AK812_SmicGene38574 [Symbiodinium microadriaticum]
MASFAHLRDTVSKERFEKLRGSKDPRIRAGRLCVVGDPYRVAFLAENQLWLQVAVSEMMDKRTLEKHRQDLLDGLASIVNEVAPKDYAAEGTEAVEKEMFQFGAPPAMDLARAASEVLVSPSLRGFHAPRLIF